MRPRPEAESANAQPGARSALAGPGATSAAFDALARRLEHALACGLLGFLRGLPYSLAWRAAECLGLAAGLLVPKWNTVAESNLRRAFPELDSRDRRRIRQDVYRNLGRVALALAKIPHWTEREVRKRVDFVGLQHFRAGEAQGRGVLLLTAHLGNWELGALAHGAVVGPLHVMVRPIENGLVDRLVTRRRETHGNRVIRKRSAARDVLRVLERSGTVGILADQNTLAGEAVFVDFFGSPAATNKGFAQLALRSNAAVIPAFARWDYRKKRHVVEYGPAIELIRTGSSAQDVVSNSQRFQSALEERIRRHPDQWLWIHQRWKTQPVRDFADQRISQC